MLIKDELINGGDCSSLAWRRLTGKWGGSARVGKASFFNCYSKDGVRKESPQVANSRENFDEEEYVCMILIIQTYSPIVY